MTFDDSIKILFDEEGGYVNNPADPGGETNFGISKRRYPNVDIKNLTREQAAQMYHSDYWLPLGCDNLPPMLACNLFGAAVNEGKGTAAKQLQEILGITADGIIGNGTIDAVKVYVKNHGELILCILFNVAVAQYYISLKNYPIFGKGWLKRLFDIYGKSIIANAG